jgi:hypothetical protein
MKIIITFLLLSFMITSCSVYQNKVIKYESETVKYEYRCLRNNAGVDIGECKEINTNYIIVKMPKDKYKHLSPEELRAENLIKKQEKYDSIKNTALGSIIILGGLFGIPIGTGIYTATNVGGGEWSSYRNRSRSLSWLYCSYINYIY